jgi:acyl-CoA synthetase (AMP-forming)/AMP-acid ligase II/thioesterase domain-containing protein
MHFFHEIFEQAVIEQPNKTAIVCGDTELTYQQLDSRANQIAEEMLGNLPSEARHPKIGEQLEIVVCLERTADLVAAFLAISKIGAIYVPIDPALGMSRVKSVLNTSKADLILVDESTSKTLENLSNETPGNDPKKINTSQIEASATVVAKPEINFSDDFCKHALLYIMFSSGTTDKPKAIPIKHSGYTNYWLGAVNDTVPNEPNMKVLSAMSCAFDAQLSEFLLAWAMLATLYLLTSGERRGQGIFSYLIKHKITDATLIPDQVGSMLKQKHGLEQKPERVNPMQELANAGLRRFYTTGRACTSEIVNECKKAGVGLFNNCGSTEQTLGFSMLPVDAEDFYQGMVPIGDSHKPHIVQLFLVKPGVENIANRQLNTFEVIPLVGLAEGEAAEGELIVASPYLTPGYYNNDEENKKNFCYLIKDDERLRCHIPGDKILARRKQGKLLLYYQGRVSAATHVKIRGEKVIPAEIEAHLHNLPAVAQAAVVYTEESPFPVAGKDGALVAFIKFKTGQSLSIKEIRESLASTLPPKAIPPIYAFLPDGVDFQRNAKQQIDRNWLIEKISAQIANNNEQPIQFLQYSQTSNSHAVPDENNIVQQVKRIWGELFPKSNICCDVPFDALGGDSIVFGEMILAIKKQFQLPKFDLSLIENSTNFAFTLQDIADAVYIALCRQADLNDPEASTVTVKQAYSPQAKTLFCFHALTGDDEQNYLPLANEFENSNIIFLRPPQFLSPVSLQAMLRFYREKIKSCQPQGPYYFIGWSSGGLLAYAMARLFTANNDKVNYVGVVDEVAPHLVCHPGITRSQLSKLIETLSTVSIIEEAGSAKNVLQLQQAETTDVLPFICNVFAQLCATPGKEAQFAFIQYFLIAQFRYCLQTQVDTSRMPLHVYTSQATAELCQQQHIEQPQSLGWGEQRFGRSEQLLTRFFENTDHFSIMQNKGDDELFTVVANDLLSADFVIKQEDLSQKVEVLTQVVEDLQSRMEALQKMYQKAVAGQEGGAPAEPQRDLSGRVLLPPSNFFHETEKALTPANSPTLASPGKPKRGSAPATLRPILRSQTG